MTYIFVSKFDIYNIQTYHLLKKEPYKIEENLIITFNNDIPNKIKDYTFYKMSIEDANIYFFKNNYKLIYIIENDELTKVYDYIKKEKLNNDRPILYKCLQQEINNKKIRICFAYCYIFNKNKKSEKYKLSDLPWELIKIICYLII